MFQTFDWRGWVSATMDGDGIRKWLRMGEGGRAEKVKFDTICSTTEGTKDRQSENEGSGDEINRRDAKGTGALN